jgi:hypothetical protein
VFDQDCQNRRIAVNCLKTTVLNGLRWSDMFDKRKDE